MSSTILMCPICQEEISRNGTGKKCPRCAYKVEEGNLTSVTPQELNEKIKKGEKVVLVDVRQQSEFEFAHLKNARHISLATLPQKLKELGKKDEIVVYCHRGMRSHHAALFLKQKGFNATSLKGGIDKWSLLIDGGVPRY